MISRTFIALDLMGAVQGAQPVEQRERKERHVFSVRTVDLKPVRQVEHAAQAEVLDRLEAADFLRV